jgi:demethylmenaquinone methyltransferase/2-methoxy-6-polyprenyl-1,4-benzoquinol methylase
MTADGPVPADRALLDEQIAYYRARAPEYEEWWNDHRANRPAGWTDEVRALEAIVERFRPAGSVLELACGTGIWTRRIVRWADRITAVDGAPETIALNRDRLPDGATIEFVVADLFEWEPPERYDVVFFSFWLSHVPSDRWESFWNLVDHALTPGGRFFIIDNRETYVTSSPEEPAEGYRDRRTLRDGRKFRIVKEFFEPDELVERLARLGWDASAGATGLSFVYAEGRRAVDSDRRST